MSQKKYYTVCSSHLDREWYASFEETRIFTDAIINRVLDMLSKMPEYVYMLDGQTSVLEDYLEIYPEREEEIRRFIQEGRLLVGPWYIQPDECIPAGESIVRNLLLGEKIAKRYGETAKIGYVPDSFGHVSQLPQIFKDFGIKGVFLMRGCPDNTPRDFVWRGADGTEMLTIQYPYGTGGQMDPDNMRLGIRPDRTKEEYQSSLEKLDHMDGFSPIAPYTLVTLSGDMLPPPKKIEEFGIPSYDRFTDCLAENEKVRDRLPVLCGELRESPDIVYSLQDTLVSRVYLKQENQKAQNQLMHFAEGLSALVFGSTGEYPAGSLAKSWKYLLENHTHDGICGCSNDDVCREMMTRFRKSLNISETWSRIALEKLAGNMDTSFAMESDAGNHWDTQDYGVLVVFNPLPYPLTEAVSVDVLYPADKAPLNFVISDSEGNICPSQLMDVRDRELIRSDFESVQHFTKDRVYRIAFQTGNLPAYGVKAFRLDKIDNEQENSAAECGLYISKENRTIENKWVILTVEENGTLTLEDKNSGQVYHDLNYFTEEGDGGDTYAFRPIPGGAVYDSRDLKWEISFKQEGPVACVCRMKAAWDLPKEMTGQGTGRSLETVANTLEYEVTVLADSPVIRVKLQIGNRSADHRIRACFPTKCETEHVWADGQFSLEKRAAFRDIRRGNTQPQQTFCAVGDQDRGLAVFEKGLHQYEYLKDADHTLALSLLRGQGVLYRAFFERYNEEFSECQCIGDFEMEYAICAFVPDNGRLPDNILVRAAQFNTGIQAAQTGKHTGSVAPVQSFMQIEAGSLQFVSMKLSEDRSRILARFYNPYPEKKQVQIRLAAAVDGVVRMNLHEDVLDTIWAEGGLICFEAAPCEIVTLGFDGVFSPLGL